jgi:large subunit ribosomal protein L19e
VKHVSVRSQRRLAAKILKTGENRVWVDPNRTDDVEVAISREEIRKLIHEGVIKRFPVTGVSRARARIIHKKKKKGLRRGPGRSQGSSTARVGRKEIWMAKIRALRRRLRELKTRRIITQKNYRQLYSMAGSGVFKSVADLERHVKAQGQWRKR